MTRDLKISTRKISEKLELFKDATVLIFHADQTDMEKAIFAWHFLHPAPALISIGENEENTIRVKKINKADGKTTISISYEGSLLN